MTSARFRNCPPPVFMTPERWRQVEEIFQAALNLGPEEREQYVSQACVDDTTLKRDVETLLSQNENAGDLLEAPLYGATVMNSSEFTQGDS